MASRLNPYIHFTDGNAREALEFYRDVFGGELHLSTFGDVGQAEPPLADKVMHGQLETTAGYTLMVSDTPPGMDVSPGNHITISLSGDDGDELRRYWEQLAAGGSIHVPLEKQMWGDEFGQLADRYGIQWMVNITQPR